MTPPPAVSINTLPTISGQPRTQATVGVPYNFFPGAHDDDGDTLSFSIENKPAWATFSTSTGQLSGTPASTNIGSYAGIVIRVSDGHGTSPLAAFTLSVVAAGGGSANGMATLSWTVPTKNTDGTVLTDLAGFWVYHGTSVGNLSRLQQIASGATTQYVVTGLASGTHYFAVSAYNSANVESALSATGSKTIP